MRHAWAACELQTVVQEINFDNQNMKRNIWILLFALTACNSISNDNKSTTQLNDTTQFSADFIKTTKDSISIILNTLSKSTSYEFTDLYLDTDTIPENDFLILDDSLKARGFVVKDWGRGNFMEGARMISLTLENKTCKCRVDKLYYTNISKSKKYKVTVRISCNSKTTKQ